MKSTPPVGEHSDVVRPIGLRPLSDADYRLMVEEVVDYAIFMLDVNGVIRSWNKGAALLKGYTADDVVGQHFSMFYPQDMKDRQWPQYELEEASRTGRFEDEGWRLRKDGTRFWANIIITRLLGPNGEVRGFSKITRDLSERRRQEELLRLSEERFRLLVDSVQDYAIFMLDPGGYVVSWNPGAEKNQGYKAAEIIGKHFSVFYPEDSAGGEAPAKELETALKVGRFEDQGWRVRKDGSRFWAGVVLTAIFDETGRHRGFAKITRDLTQARKMSLLEDESRRITTFLAMLGHELRNPLAPMANAVSLMHLENLPGPALASARNVIDRQLKQMTRLVDDLLDVGRITSGKINLEKKPVGLRDVMSQAVEAAEPLIKAKGHHFHVDTGTTEAWVSGDRLRLIQVITNLLNNAAKFTPANGSISLVLDTRAGAAQIRVNDNGPGVPEHMRDVIFELFVQGRQDIARTQGGLGLGLALSRQLIALHGGTIEVYSKGQAGAGSEFLVQLPLIAAPSIKQAAQTATARKKILIVDDNRDAADTMCMLVRSLGFDAEAAYDGLAAVTRTLASTPDVLLLDIGLPGLSGLDVARRIEAEMLYPPKLIAISGYGQESDREATFKAGFFAHLAKPVDFDELSELLKRLL